MQVAILGTGLMGAAVARRLEARGGFELTLWNRTRSRAEAVGVGGVAETPAAAAANAEVVVTSLFDPDALRQVYLGEGGVLAAGAGKAFLETSTAGPGVLRELQQRVRAVGGALIDAPLLGSTGAVESGSLEIPVGAEPVDVERVTPILDALGEHFHVGPVGAAATMKLVHNSMLAVATVVGSELIAAGAAAGLEREAAMRMVSRIAPYLRRRERALVHREYEPVTFALTGMVKDLDLALGLYHDCGATTPVTALVRELYAEAARSWGSLDVAAVAERYAGAKRDEAS
jgi:3-hydroxyisobutyrate dehydrogenase